MVRKLGQIARFAALANGAAMTGQGGHARHRKNPAPACPISDLDPFSEVSHQLCLSPGTNINV
jgi:hypothetical protein